jgi:hypothetical protein
VRGDSLRDLYAKVLALCGLGLLAGAGALVDYWPVQAELPRVSSGRADLTVRLPRIISTPSIAAAPSVVKVTAANAAPAPRAARRAPARVQQTAERARSTERPAAFPASHWPVVHAADATTMIGSVTFSFDAPDAPPSAALTLDAAVRSRPIADPIGTQVVSIALPDETVANHDAEAGGFLSGAFRKTGAVASASIVKTGDAIVRGGAVAGASIVDAFRGLAGAVKKVSPFVP